VQWRIDQGLDTDRLSAASLGLGLTWAMFLSSSASMADAPGALPHSLLPSAEHSALSTSFLCRVLFTTAILSVASVSSLNLSAPSAQMRGPPRNWIRTAGGVSDRSAVLPDRASGWNTASSSHPCGRHAGCLSGMHLAQRTMGALRCLDLNTYNWIFWLRGYFLPSTFSF